MTRAAPVVVGRDRGDDGERGMDGDGSRRRIRRDGGWMGAGRGRDCRGGVGRQWEIRGVGTREREREREMRPCRMRCCRLADAFDAP